MAVSELELWEVDSNVSGFCSLSYWRSKLNNRPDYNIILKQRDLDTQRAVEASTTFVLYESSALDSSQQAFEEVRSTLEPLVDDGNLMMTQKFLKEIITPKPVEASRLVIELVEIMDKNVCSYMYTYILPYKVYHRGTEHQQQILARYTKYRHFQTYSGTIPYVSLFLLAWCSP